MSAQIDLFDDGLRARFLAFHHANPQVYEFLRRRALRAKARGFRPGMQCLFELLRWGHGMRINRGDDEFRLNNNHAAYYARLLMQQEPELAGFFELRRVSDDGPLE